MCNCGYSAGGCAKSGHPVRVDSYRGDSSVIAKLLESLVGENKHAFGRHMLISLPMERKCWLGGCNFCYSRVKIVRYVRGGSKVHVCLPPQGIL